MYSDHGTKLTNNEDHYMIKEDIQKVWKRLNISEIMHYRKK